MNRTNLNVSRHAYGTLLRHMTNLGLVRNNAVRRTYYGMLLTSMGTASLCGLLAKNGYVLAQHSHTFSGHGSVVTYWTTVHYNGALIASLNY